MDLQAVLTYAFRGEIEKLPYYLVKEDRITYNSVCKEVSKYDMEKRSGTFRAEKKLQAPTTSRVLNLPEGASL